MSKNKNKKKTAAVNLNDRAQIILRTCAEHIIFTRHSAANGMQFRAIKGIENAITFARASGISQELCDAVMLAWVSIIGNDNARVFIDMNTDGSVTVLTGGINGGTLPIYSN